MPSWFIMFWWSWSAVQLTAGGGSCFCGAGSNCAHKLELPRVRANPIATVDLLRNSKGMVSAFFGENPIGKQTLLVGHPKTMEPGLDYYKLRTAINTPP